MVAKGRGTPVLSVSRIESMRIKRGVTDAPETERPLGALKYLC